MPAVFVEFEANLIRKCARESMSAACDSHADNLCIQHAMSFEWDKDKNRANWIKHGIDFETARQIFDGPVLTRSDRRRDYGEERHISIGQAGRAVMVVAHTMRGRHVRLISARPASRRERKDWHEWIR